MPPPVTGDGIPWLTPTAQLHEDQDSPDRNKCKQADLESELVTKHSRDETLTKSKEIYYCVPRKEGRPDIIMVQVCCEQVRTVRRGMHTRSDFASFCINLHANYDYCF